ncbi:hypothetical protein PAHAL_5G358300 [Panicum hallii]|uniref:Uncharacterized protein n=1 Tax=Panicum hallii TaxID=206008 RepID=A0A2T8IMB6_9POAL|nr:hypothetical protein PAHAL_5G358300 [Panicum hallii]
MIIPLPSVVRPALTSALPRRRSLRDRPCQASARHYAHARATRSASLTFLPLQHLHRRNHAALAPVLARRQFACVAPHQLTPESFAPTQLRSSLARSAPARVPHIILYRMPPLVPFHIRALPAPRRRSPSSYRDRLFCLRRPSPAPVHAIHYCAEPLSSACLHSPRALRSHAFSQLPLWLLRRRAHTPGARYGRQCRAPSLWRRPNAWRPARPPAPRVPPVAAARTPPRQPRRTPPALGHHHPAYCLGRGRLPHAPRTAAAQPRARGPLASAAAQHQRRLLLVPLPRAAPRLAAAASLRALQCLRAARPRRLALPHTKPSRRSRSCDRPPEPRRNPRAPVRQLRTCAGPARRRSCVLPCRPRETRGREEQEIRAPPVEDKKEQREEKQRRKGTRISQGPLHNFRKLQGPVCKTKFPVDLKPK